MNALRPAWVEIDLDAMAYNVRQIRQLIGPNCKLFAVIKGDAYGTGVIEASRTAAVAGADALALGNASDIPGIRACGVDLPILLYGSTLPEQASAVADLGVIATVHDFEGLEAFGGLERQVEVFVKVDCGLGRLGFGPEQWQAAFHRLAELPSIRVAGLYTHFSNPDNKSLTEHQAKLFLDACHASDTEGHQGYERMVASSRVILTRPDLNFTAVNPGRLLYGYLEGEYRERIKLRPVVASLKARVLQVKTLPSGAMSYGESAPLTKPIRAAVVPIGFLDGLNHLPPCHVALLRGRRVRVLGRRGVEHTVLDVSDVPEAAVGDEVVFLGEQGGEVIDGPLLAQALQLPMLELLPRLARMAPRRYLPIRS